MCLKLDALTQKSTQNIKDLNIKSKAVKSVWKNLNNKIHHFKMEKYLVIHLFYVKVRNFGLWKAIICLTF